MLRGKGACLTNPMNGAQDWSNRMQGGKHPVAGALRSGAACGVRCTATGGLLLASNLITWSAIDQAAASTTLCCQPHLAQVDLLGLNQAEQPEWVGQQDVHLAEVAARCCGLAEQAATQPTAGQQQFQAARLLCS